MQQQIIESTSAKKRGWGSDMWRKVVNLQPEEREAVKAGALVYFRFKPWHHKQSGYKVVTHNLYGYDSREPTVAELKKIKEVSDV